MSVWLADMWLAGNAVSAGSGLVVDVLLGCRLDALGANGDGRAGEKQIKNCNVVWIFING